MNTTSGDELLNRALRNLDNVEKGLLRIPAKMNRDKEKYKLFVRALDEIEQLKETLNKYRELA